MDTIDDYCASLFELSEGHIPEPLMRWWGIADPSDRRTLSRVIHGDIHPAGAAMILADIGLTLTEQELRNYRKSFS